MENLLIDRQSLEAYVRLRHSLSRTGDIEINTLKGRKPFLT
jgi:hypothetical protein